MICNWQDKEYISNVVAKHQTYTDIIKDLGLQVKSGNFQTLLKYIKIYNINISHLNGKEIAYNKLKLANKKKLLSNENYFIKDVFRNNHTTKKRILTSKLKKYECAECNHPPTWNGKELILQLDHIDGDRFNNLLENLRFLCPNCHSQTETYGGSNLKKDFDFHNYKEEIKSKDKIINLLKENGIEATIKFFKISSSKFKSLCNIYEINLNNYKKSNQSKIVWPEKETLQQKILNNSFADLSKELNVAGNAIKKHALKHGLFLPTTIHKSYWLKVKNNSYKKIEMQDLVLQEGQYLLRATIKGEKNGKRSKTESETSRKN